MHPGLLLAAVSGLAATNAAAAALPQVDMLLVAGQSNMLATGTSTVPAPIAAIDSARVKIWNGSAFVGYVAGTNSEPTGADPTKWGPEANYAIAWLAANATGTLYIVKRPVAGTAISTWQPGQTNFTNMTTWVSAARAALAGVSANASVLWGQGESDAIVSQALADTYAASLTTTLAGIRSSWGDASTKIAVMRIYDANMTYRSTIRAAQASVTAADALAYLVNTDDSTLVDTYHYDNASQQTLGSRMYTAINTGADVLTPADQVTATFTAGADTALNAYTPETGGSFAYLNSTGTVLSASGQLRGDASSTMLATVSTVPASANYSVRADVSYATSTSDTLMGVMGRVLDVSNYYSAFYEAIAGTFTLAKNVAGTPTILGSAYTDVFGIGVVRTVELRMVGTSIKVFINGISRISVVDSSLTLAGKAGVRARINGRVDYLRVY